MSLNELNHLDLPPLAHFLTSTKQTGLIKSSVLFFQNSVFSAFQSALYIFFLRVRIYNQRFFGSN